MNRRSNDSDWENFSQNVVYLRKQHGLSKKRMAELLEISVGTLNKIERGELPPRLSVKVCVLIWAHFNIRLSDQFGRRVPTANSRTESVE